MNLKKTLQLMNKKGQRISGDILEMAIAGILIVVAVIIMVTITTNLGAPASLQENMSSHVNFNVTQVGRSVTSGLNQAATFFVIIGLMVGAGYVLNKIFGIFSGAGR